MKNILLLAGSILFTSNCYSQTNLVNNGSFESFSNCPTAFSQIEYANGWKKSYVSNANTGGWHVEYLNSCNPGSWVGMPLNGWGTQNAFDGNGYICQCAAAQAIQAEYRENVYTQLSSPLIIGNTYRVSYRISLGDECQYSTDHICAKFGTDTVFAIDNQSHASSGLVTDKISWTLVSQTFVADSAYIYLCIGNFYTDANTQFVHTYPGSSNINSTYYIDSVQVIQVTGKINVEENFAGDFLIQVFPNPANDQITVTGLKPGELGFIEMYDMQGRLVQTWNTEFFYASDLTLHIPINIPKGMYFVRFAGESTSRATKLLIE